MIGRLLIRKLHSLLWSTDLGEQHYSSYGPFQRPQSHELARKCRDQMFRRDHTSNSAILFSLLPSTLSAGLHMSYDVGIAQPCQLVCMKPAWVNK